MDSLLIAQTKWKSWVLALCSLSGITVSSYFLQKDFYTLTSANRGEELGQVVACDSDAKRKHADSYLWSRLGQGQAVYLKDSIRVGPQGFANISLNNGTKIELGENSLVIIDDPKTLAVKFVRGSFIVADARGERLVSVQKDGRALERDLLVKMLLPAPSTRFLRRKESPVPVVLTWAFKPDADAKVKAGARLLIGRDRLFQSNVISVPLADQKTEEWQGKLPTGRYYWKIAGASENLSEIRDFTVVAVDPLIAISPTRNEVMSLYSGHLNVPFRWIPESPQNGLAVFLDVSPSEKFTEVARSQEVDPRTGLAVLDGLTAGKYFWRLRSQFAGETVTSPPSAFTLGVKEKIEMALKAPNEGSTYEVGTDVRFAWETIEGEFDYRWELEGPLGAAAEAVSGNKVSTSKSSSNTWTPEVTGSYRWRVLPFFNGAQVGESEWRPLTVVAAQPVNLLKPDAQEKISFWDRNWKVPFSWQDQSGGEGKGYRLKISEDMAFKKNVVVLKTTNNELTWTPAVGDEGGYRFWMVEWIGANEEVIRMSGPRRFFFGMADVLAPPRLKFPEPDFAISLNETVQDPELTWEPLEKAVSYEVMVQREGKVWQEKSSKDTSLTLKKLKPGNYTWSVRAIDILKRKGEFSAPRPFVVKQGAKLKAPTKTEWEIE